MGERVWRRRAFPYGVLTTLVAVRAAVYLHAGVGLFLDDYGVIYNKEHRGLVGANPLLRSFRPAGWLVHLGVYGVAGRNRVVLFALVTFFNLAAALALYVVARLYLAKMTALLVAAMWVVLPNHNTLTVWAAESNEVVSVILVLGGAFLLARSRWLAAAVCLAASVLAVEISLPLCLVAALVVGTPLLPTADDVSGVHRSPITPRQRAAIVAFVALAGAWVALHSPYPFTLHFNSPVTLWSAHFGSGLLATHAAAAAVRAGLAAVAAIGVAVSLVLLWRGERGREDGPVLVLAGLVVMALGLGTTLFRTTEAFGNTDRFYALSSIGAAMVWVGLAQVVWRRSRGAAVVSFASLCVLCSIGQVVSLRSWSQAGHDTDHLLAHIESISDHPASSDFVIDGRRYRNGVTGLYSNDVAGYYALHLRFGPGTGRLDVAPPPADLDPVRADHATVIHWVDVNR